MVEAGNLKITYDTISYWCFLALSMMIMMNLNGVFGVFLKINAPFSPLILLSAVLMVLFSPVRASDITLPFKILVAFFLYFFTAGFFTSILLGSKSEDVMHSSRAIITSLLLVFAYYLHFKSIDKQGVISRITTIFYIFFATALFTSLESFLGYKTVFTMKDEARATGFFGNPNETGLQANLLLLLTLYQFMTKRINSLVFSASLAAALYSAFLSFSKAAILLAAVVLIYYIIYYLLFIRLIGKAAMKRFTGFVVTATIFIVVVVVPKIVGYLEGLSFKQLGRLKDLGALVFEGEINEDTTSERSVIMKEAFSVFLDRPFFGHGMNSFSTSDLFIAGIGTHNTYLKMLGEGGIFAFLLWLLFLSVMTYCITTVKSHHIRFLGYGFLGIISFYFMVSHVVLDRKFVVPILAIIIALVDSKVVKKQELSQTSVR